MNASEVIRVVGPILAALATALLVDRMARRRRLDPPGFAEPLRRASATAILGFTLYIGVFAAMGSLGQGGGVTFDGVSDWQLFTLQILFVFTVGAWFLLGFAGVRGAAPVTHLDVPFPAEPEPPSLASRFARQLGFAAPNPWREVGIGVIAGVGAWLVVLLGMVAVALLLSTLFGEEWMPEAPPAAIPWIAARPILLRLGIAVAAGLVEETFFRGLLQPRIGIALSTALFALAHLSYDQPLMLIGITLLSLLYGALVRWRGNILPAVVAHFLFDAVQLLVVIPAVLKFVSAGSPQ